jgi:hypothetical protein
MQIVEEQGEGMVRTREHADEPTEYQLEAALRILWRKLRNRRLLSDNELQFGQSEQPHNDRRHRGRHIGQAFVRRQRFPRDMTVNPTPEDWKP